MFRNSLLRILHWPLQKLTQLRHDLGNYWYTCDKGNLIFISLLGASVGILLFIVLFAYVEHSRIAFERQRNVDLVCLARNIYYEARGESIAGQLAVAEVTLNRVASRRFPDTVCEAVYEKRWDSRRKRYVGAFSWTEFEKVSRPKGVAWEHAITAAQRVYDDEQKPLVHGALYYHSTTVKPKWASEKKRVATIGRHIFYE